MDDYKKLRADFERMKKNEHERITDRVLAERAAEAEKIAGPDPRDAEIAALKAELADTRAELGRAMLTGREIEHENNRLRRALAAGPAALRKWDDIYGRQAAIAVEAAQAAAMKDDDHG